MSRASCKLASFIYVAFDRVVNFLVVMSPSSSRVHYAPVLSRLDYCNAMFLLVFHPLYLAPHERVLHDDARLVDELKPNDHVTAALKNLHWLPVKQHIECKVCLLAHKASVSQAPVYMSAMHTAYATVPALTRLRSSSSGLHRPKNNPETRWKGVLCCGTHCLITLNQLNSFI